ncbi:uncharacterized protein UBRO_20805 [Ustilago bromivora]|uniref:Uncharacterized protein n=1 Tax=Ustilago bromivora TaxID=307758 RepID=A0A1K0HH76_9BASI|nr:uncharacterized protein UBRO_20805 [Ustilago bromivora]
MVDVGVFQNVGEGVSTTHFIRAFSHYLFENRANQDNKHSTKLFLSFLDGRAKKWAETQPDDVKNSWKALKPAFLVHFQLDETSVESPQVHYNAYFDHLKLQITFLCHHQEWDKWLRCLLELLMDVLSEMVTQWGLAHAAWMSLPSELQAAIPQPKRGVIEFINIYKSHDMEIHWELKNELQCNLATSVEEQVHKAPDSLRFQMMPASPPMQQGQLSPPQMCQLPAPPVHQPLTPPHDFAQFTEITQQTFLDTPQGKVNYEAALHDLEARHPHATIQLPKDEPYPLTPGTLRPRSNEFHHCGQDGHCQVACINGAVPQPKQNYH